MVVENRNHSKDSLLSAVCPQLPWGWGLLGLGATFVVTRSSPPGFTGMGDRPSKAEAY